MFLGLRFVSGSISVCFLEKTCRTLRSWVLGWSVGSFLEKQWLFLKKITNSSELDSQLVCARFFEKPRLFLEKTSPNRPKTNLRSEFKWFLV